MIVPFECPQCGESVKAERNPDSNTAVCPQCGAEAAVALGVVPGVVLGNGYRLDEVIEESSSGDTFLAYQVAMDRAVMVKTLPPSLAYDDEKLGRFQREAKLTGSLMHPNILSAIDAGADSGVYYLVTEHKPGKTLRLCLKEHDGHMAEKQALKLLTPIAEALQYAWRERKILHRNVKPENVYVTDSGDALLMNLGIAKSLADDAMQLTQTGFTVGTPEYMSPEQVQGEEVDFRADLYSLGILLYRCVTGRVPFAGANQVAVMTMQIEETPVPALERNPSISKQCSSLIDKMLAKDPAQRQSSWQELIDAMRALSSGKAPTGPAAAIAGGKRKAKRRVGAASAAAGSAGSRITRKDVEQIAEALGRRPSVGTKLLLYALVTVVPLALFVYAFVHMRAAKSTPEKDRRAPAQLTPLQAPDTAPSAAPEAGPVADEDDGKEQEMFDYAASYWQEHPVDFDAALAKFAVVKEQTAGTKYAIQADEMMGKVEAAKEQAIADTVADLTARSDTLVQAGKLTEALSLVQTYDGPLAAETAADRDALAKVLDKRLAAARAEKKAKAAEAEKQAAAAKQRMIAALFAGKGETAAKIAHAALQQPVSAASKAEMEELRTLAEQYAGRDELVLEEFRKSIGKPMRVRLLERGSLELEPRSVENGKVTAVQTMKAPGGKGSVQMTLTVGVRQLHAKSQIELISRAAPARCDALCGLIAYRAGRRDTALDYFKREKSATGGLLLKALQK